MSRYLLTALALSIPLSLAACGSAPKPAETSAPAPAVASTPPAAQTPSPSNPAKYDLKGKVVAVDKAGQQLTVNHDMIPGFMGAMTMAYKVKDPKLLDNLTPGEAVTAKVVSTGSEFWLEDIAPAQ